jgi:hypothetical protein
VIQIFPRLKKKNCLSFLSKWRQTTSCNFSRARNRFFLLYFIHMNLVFKRIEGFNSLKIRVPQKINRKIKYIWSHVYPLKSLDILLLMHAVTFLLKCTIFSLGVFLANSISGWSVGIWMKVKYNIIIFIEKGTNKNKKYGWIF